MSIADVLYAVVEPRFKALESGRRLLVPAVVAIGKLVRG